MPELMGQAFSGDKEELAWREVAQREIIPRQGCECFHGLRSLHSNSELREMRAQCAGDGLRSTAGNGPSHRMSGCAQQYSSSGTKWFI